MDDDMEGLSHILLGHGNVLPAEELAEIQLRHRTIGYAKVGMTEDDGEYAHADRAALLAELARVKLVLVAWQQMHLTALENARIWRDRAEAVGWSSVALRRGPHSFVSRLGDSRCGACGLTLGDWLHMDSE